MREVACRFCSRPFPKVKNAQVHCSDTCAELAHKAAKKLGGIKFRLRNPGKMAEYQRAYRKRQMANG